MTNGESVINELKLMIGKDRCTTKQVGILLAPKKEYIKKERNENGKTSAQELSYIKSRKVKHRPTKDELFDMVKTQSFTQIGRKYGVADNTIKKWCRQYGLPYRKKDIILLK